LVIHDSNIEAKKAAILVPDQNLGWRVDLVLRNIKGTGTNNIVATPNGKTILPGNQVDAWASGFRYSAKHPDGLIEEGPLALDISPGLLKDGRIFARDKPQYAENPASDFLDVVRGFSIKNDGDEKDAMENTLRLRLALAAAMGGSKSPALTKYITC
jgi:hypothetical protein